MKWHKITFFLIIMSMLSLGGIFGEDLYQNPFPPASELKIDPQPADLELIIESDGIPWLVLSNAEYLRLTYTDALIFIDRRLEDLEEDDKLIKALNKKVLDGEKRQKTLIGIGLGLGTAVVVLSLILIFK